ncbi:DUF116 domain-containing protein [bacterium]|nr:DUF116 domain-containing protein [bacterium]
MKGILLKIRSSKTAFWSGVALLIINPPLGWVGFLIGGYLSAKYENPKYMFIATIIYAITWGMAGMGLLLAGPKGVALAQNFFKKISAKVFHRSGNIDEKNINNNRNTSNSTDIEQNREEIASERVWGKAPFLLISWLAYITLALFLMATFYLAEPRLFQISHTAAYIVGAIFAIAIITLGGGLLLITLTSITGMDLLYPHGKTQITMRILPPVVYLLGTSIFRLDKDKLRESFVAVSNALFWAQAIKNRFSAKRLLILLPHCIQWHKCPWKITWSIENCRKCNKCPLGKLVDLHGKSGISIYVATGGTVARRVVMEARPTMILAVACPRDLSEGMVDVYPIPVYGILLSRPNGPCFDTYLEIEKVRKFLKIFRPDVYSLTENW